MKTIKSLLIVLSLILLTSCNNTLSVKSIKTNEKISVFNHNDLYKKGDTIQIVFRKLSGLWEIDNNWSETKLDTVTEYLTYRSAIVEDIK